MKNVKIIVASHKKYQMPRDEMYLPLQILHNKEQYNFLKFDKTKRMDVYKICDTNVGDPQYSKGKPCTLEEQLEAASIIDDL